MRTLRLLQTKKELVLLALCYIYVLFFPNEAPLELGIRVSDDEKYIYLLKKWIAITCVVEGGC